MSRTQIFVAVRPHGPSSRASLCSVNIGAPGGGLRISTDPETKLMFVLREENFDQPNAAGIPDERVEKAPLAVCSSPVPAKKQKKVAELC